MNTKGKNGKIKIIVAVALFLMVALATILAVKMYNRKITAVWLTVYFDLDYARGFQFINDDYYVSEINSEHIRAISTKYRQVTLTLDDNYTPKDGEVFFYPSERTQIVVDDVNEYLEDEGPIEGYDGISRILTIEDVVMHKDVVQKIIDSMTTEYHEDIFSRVWPQRTK